MGAAGYCWILEDFHKVDDSEKSKLSQLMKIFMDLSDEFPTLKIVALGAVDTARQVVDYDPEMRFRVSEIHVELMTPQEIESVIAKGEDALNVIFDTEVKSLISKYSNGLASVCHHLCLNMCDAAGITSTCPLKFSMTRGHFESAIRIYVEEASDSIRSAFDKALKVRRKTTYNNSELILQALSSFKERGASRTDLHNRIRRTAPTYPVTSLKNCLPKLTTQEYGGIVRFDSNSGLYSFSDPIHRAFALAHFRDPETSQPSIDTDLGRLLSLLTKELTRHFPKGLEGKALRIK